MSVLGVNIGIATSCSSTRAREEQQPAEDAAAASEQNQPIRRDLTSDELRALLQRRSSIAILGIRVTPKRHSDSPFGDGLSLYLWDDGLIVYRDHLDKAVTEPRIGILPTSDLNRLQRMIDAMPEEYDLKTRRGRDTIGDTAPLNDKLSSSYPWHHVWARLTNGKCVHVAWDQLIETEHSNLPHGALESLVQVRDDFLPRVRELLPRSSRAFSEYEELVLKSRHWIEGSWRVLPGCD